MKRGTLPSILRGHRLARGLSLAQMAVLLAEAGVSRTRAMLHHYEKGKASVCREVLDAYVQALELHGPAARELYEAGGLIVQVSA